MSPRRAVTVRLWALGLAFAIITAIFTVGLVIVTRQAHHIAAVDRAARIRDATRAEERRRDRDAQIAGLHRIAIKSCHDRHVMNAELRRLIRESIASSRRLDLTSFPPPQRQAIERSIKESIARFQGSLERLRKADCRGIPAIPAAQATILPA